MTTSSHVGGPMLKNLRKRRAFKRYEIWREIVKTSRKGLFIDVKK